MKLWLGLFCATLVAPSSALACPHLPYVPCFPGSLTPARATLPANAVMWSWSLPYNPGYEKPDGSVVRPRLYQRANGQRSELPLSDTSTGDWSAWLAPTSEPAVGSVLELSYAYSCGEAERVASEITVAPSAPRPSSLGTLVATSATGPITIDPCAEMVEVAYADLRLELSASATPYRDGLQNALKIDGEFATWLNHQYPGQPELPPAANYGGVVRVFAPCGVARPELANLPRGRHRVQVVARLPDGTSVASEELEVELTCASVAGADAGASRDAGARVDASVAVDASADAAVRGNPDAGNISPASSDDGCSLGGKGNVSWLALAFGLLLARRRHIRT